MCVHSYTLYYLVVICIPAYTIVLFRVASTSRPSRSEKEEKRARRTSSPGSISAQR